MKTRSLWQLMTLCVIQNYVVFDFVCSRITNIEMMQQIFFPWRLLIRNFASHPKSQLDQSGK